MLQAQIAALSGSVSNQAARAELAKLQAQLKEAQDEIADTRYQHDVEMQQQGYDKLSEDTNKILEDTLKQIDAEQAVRDETIRYELGLLNGHTVEASTAITGIINQTGTAIDQTSRSQLDEDLKTNAKLDELITDAKDKTWEEGISSAITNLDTSQIKTWNENTKAIEEKITQDINQLLLPAINDGKLDMTGSETELKSIKTALEQFKDAYTEAQNKKASDENKGNDAFGQNKTAEADDNGPSIVQQQELINQLSAAAASVATQQSTVSSISSKIAAAENSKQSAYDKYANAQAAYQKAKDTYKAKKTDKNKAKKTKAKANLDNAKKAYDAATANLANLRKELAAQEEELKRLQNIQNQVQAQLSASGYAKGSKSTKDELNWLHDSEVIIRKSDGAILQPFNSGDMVFTSKQSENLWKMSQLPAETIKQMVANPDMSKFIQPGITDRLATTENNNQTIHFDSLITINGNADEQTVMDIQQIAEALISNRNFKQNVTKFVTKDLTRDAKKAGYRG